LIPVLTQGLAVKQESRYQTAREFVQAIKDVLPKLKATPASSSADDATAVVQESTQIFTASKDELDSMTNLLVDYVGPIAKNIMYAHNAENTSVSELASEIAREIPEPEEREAFLRRWEDISGTRIDATPTSVSTKARGKIGVVSFDADMLEKLGEDYTCYMGPMAVTLVRHYAASTDSLEQLVDWLAGEIPDSRDSQKFRDAWL